VAEVLPCGGSFNQAGEASSTQLKLLLLGYHFSCMNDTVYYPNCFSEIECMT